MQVKEVIEEWKRIVSPEKFEKAFVDTLNDIALKAFTKSRKEIEKKWEIKFSKKNRFHYKLKSKQTGHESKRAGDVILLKADTYKKEASLNVLLHKGEGIPLYLFPFKAAVVRYKTGKAVNFRKNIKLKPLDQIAVKVKVQKNKPAVVLTRVFEATMESGHTGFFYRTDDTRLPIKEKRVVSLSYMFTHINENKGFESILEEIWDEKAEERFEYFIMRELRR